MKNSSVSKRPWRVRRSTLRRPFGVLSLVVLVGAACMAGRSSSEVPQEPPASAQAAARAASGPSKKYGTVPSEVVVGQGGPGALQLAGKTELGSRQLVDVQGQEFDQAVRVEVKQRSGQPWDLQLTAQANAAVEAGDVLLASFWFRTPVSADESGEGIAELNFEMNHRPHVKLASHEVRGGPEWKQVFVPFKAQQSLAKEEAQLTFRLAYAEQTVEIAEVQVENFGQKLTVADLPRTKSTYPGQEKDAPWRKAAAERIEQLRKADLTVKVVDSKGNAVPDAAVHAVLQEHEFNFGTCAPAATLLDSDNEKYNGLVTELFNMVTLENDLKWQPLAGDWEPDFTLERALKGIDWIEQQGLRPRGHVLVWPGWRNLPKSIKALEKNPEAMRQATLEHIRELVTATKGRLAHWDVVNEPFTNHELLDILGHEVMIDWFKLVKELDPKPRLYINDFAILNGGGGTTEHRDHYEKMIQLLVDGGAPLEGIGMQGHFGSSLTSPEDLMKILDRYGKFGKKIAVTEYDIVITDEELAADYTRDFYTVLFSHPLVDTLIMWGFWDNNHWKKNALMYRNDWSLKPGGQVYKDLVFKEWHTDVTGSTDSAGAFQLRGFKGEYQVEVRANGQTRTAKGSLTDGGTTLTVKI